MGRPVVVLDACVLIPMPLCDILLRAAEKGLYRFHTSPEILQETVKNLAKLLIKKNKLDLETAHKKAKYRIEQIQESFPESLVEPSSELVSTLKNHPKDRHVLGAAIEAQKVYSDSEFDVLVFIVTHNLKDFPNDILSEHHVISMSPDDFLIKLIEVYDSEVFFDILEERSKNNPSSLFKTLENLERGKVTKFVNIILTDYYLQDILDNIRDIVNSVGWSDAKEDRCLKGETYHISIENQKLIIKKNGLNKILMEYNGHLIKGNNIVCQDIKNLQVFLEEYRNIIKR